MSAILTALADTLATYLPTYPGCSNLGFVYEQTGGLRTPDSLTLPINKPVIIFGHPFRGTHDVDMSNPHVRKATMGTGAVVNDLKIVQLIILYGVEDQNQIGTLQAIADPYHEFGVMDCLRQHNTLGTYGSPVFRAVCTTDICGAFPWGKVNYYAGQFPIEVSCSRFVTPGS